MINSSWLSDALPVSRAGVARLSGPSSGTYRAKHQALWTLIWRIAVTHIMWTTWLIVRAGNRDFDYLSCGDLLSERCAHDSPCQWTAVSAHAWHDLLRFAYTCRLVDSRTRTPSLPVQLSHLAPLQAQAVISILAYSVRVRYRCSSLGGRDVA